MNVLLLMMGGSGTRLGSELPKQYILVEDIPIFVYILNEYHKMKEIDKIVIVSNSNYLEYVQKWVDKFQLNKVFAICSGGNTRNESILNGLKEVKKMTDINANVLIHDATHPYVDKIGTQKVIDEINKTGAATLVAYNYDTVYNTEDNIITEVLDRKKVAVGASPEGLKLNDIYNIYMNSTEEELNKMTSAGAIAIANGKKMKVIETDVLNLKITFKRDLEIFRKLVNNYYFKK